MEWKAEKDLNIMSVVVPDDLFNEFFKLLQGTGISIDPYRDQVLRRLSTKTVLKRLIITVEEHRAFVEREVKKHLNIQDLPDWAKKIVDARVGQNKLVGACLELIHLCEFALIHGVDVDILGQ